MLLVFDKLGLRKRPPANIGERNNLLEHFCFTAIFFIFIQETEKFRNIQSLTEDNN